MAHVNKLLVTLVTAIIATTVTADIPSCDGLAEGTMLRTEDCTGWYKCVHGVAQDQLPCHTDMVFSMLAHTCVARGNVYDDCPYTPPGPCVDLPEGAILLDDDDCTGWSMCSNGVAIVMPACGTDLVFSRSENTCVREGELYDDCTQTVQERCDAGAVLIPHATECQLYYDCSKAEEWKGEVHLSECIYPNQFNSDTLTCDNFENVQCRGRKDIQDYSLVTAIIATTMTTVTADIPSCDGLAEGTMLRTEDCTGWYKCVHGVAQDQLPCHPDMIFSILAHTCVARGSVYDDCTYTPPGPCVDLPEGAILPHDDDCTGWSMCSNGVAIVMPACGTDLVFSRSENTCVREGELYDDCTQTVQERCDAGAVLIPHSTECQLYYNCSKAEEWKGEVHLSECIYPNQFNSDTLTCDDFENVQCRGRKDIYEYFE